jgi:hypothetical protein
MTADEWKDLRDFIDSVVIDSPHGCDKETMAWYSDLMFKLADVVAEHTGENNGQTD